MIWEGWQNLGFFWVSEIFMSFSSDGQKSIKTINTATSCSIDDFEPFSASWLLPDTRKKTFKPSSDKCIMKYKNKMKKTSGRTHFHFVSE